MSLSSTVASYCNDLIVYDKERVDAVVILTLIGFVFYYLHGWFFVLADWYGFLDKYALRSGKHRLPTHDKQMAAIKEATVDTFIMKPLTLYMMYPLLAKYVNMGELSLEEQSQQHMLVDWVIMEAAYSTLFYIVHRTLHSVTFLYKHVHKVHHSFYDTVGFAAQYHHPLESVFAGVYVLAGAIFIRPAFSTFCIFVATRFTEIIGAALTYLAFLVTLIRSDVCSYAIVLCMLFRCSLRL